MTRYMEVREKPACIMTGVGEKEEWVDGVEVQGVDGLGLIQKRTGKKELPLLSEESSTELIPTSITTAPGLIHSYSKQSHKTIMSQKRC